MSIEPLRREAVRRPGTLRATAPARPVGHQMCVVVSEVADGDGSALVTNLRRRGSHRVVVLTRRASRVQCVRTAVNSQRERAAASRRDRM